MCYGVFGCVCVCVQRLFEYKFRETYTLDRKNQIPRYSNTVQTLGLFLALYQGSPGCILPQAPLASAHPQSVGVSLFPPRIFLWETTGMD